VVICIWNTSKTILCREIVKLDIIRIFWRRCECRELTLSISLLSSVHESSCCTSSAVVTWKQVAITKQAKTRQWSFSIDRRMGLEELDRQYMIKEEAIVIRSFQ